MNSQGRRRSLVVVAGLLLLVGTLAALIGDWIAGVDAATAVLSFQIPNLMLGIPAGACGLLIAWYRPRNRLGWILVGAGLAASVSAATTPALIWAVDHDQSMTLVRTLGTTYWAWTFCQFLFIPLAVLHFPDGTLPGNRWRIVVVVVALTFVVELLFFSATTHPFDLAPKWHDLSAPSWIRVDTFGEFPAPPLEVLDYLLIFAAIAVRFRRGNEAVRRQLLWLLWSLLIAVGLFGVDATLVAHGGAFTIASLGFIGLIPVAMTIAVMRYQVLDIRLLWSRTVAWLILSAIVLGLYFALVTASDVLLRGAIPAEAPAAVIVAACFHSARMRLQRMVDARLYGERADPVRAATKVSSRITGSVSSPVDLLEPLRSTLRLPYAELRAHGRQVGASGDEVTLTESVPLAHAGRVFGELVVGVRVGQRRLSATDRSVLELLAAPLALAVRSGELSEEVQRAADEISEARVAERSRLRQDLHDGLGPLLTGIAFHSDAADNLFTQDTQRAREFIKNIRATANEAIAEVRVLIDQLRPTSVEELGLIPAIERHADALAVRPDGSRLMVVVEADDIPPLHPLTDTAIFRVVTEALNNVAKHSTAERVDVEITSGMGGLSVVVQDDGGPGGPWTPGVGLRSMTERIERIGGVLRAAPGRIGGRVEAQIPLEA